MDGVYAKLTSANQSRDKLLADMRDDLVASQPLLADLKSDVSSLHTANKHTNRYLAAVKNDVTALQTASKSTDQSLADLKCDIASLHSPGDVVGHLKDLKRSMEGLQSPAGVNHLADLKRDIAGLQSPGELVGHLEHTKRSVDVLQSPMGVVGYLEDIKHSIDGLQSPVEVIDHLAFLKCGVDSLHALQAARVPDSSRDNTITSSFGSQQTAPQGNKRKRSRNSEDSLDPTHVINVDGLSTLIWFVDGDGESVVPDNIPDAAADAARESATQFRSEFPGYRRICIWRKGKYFSLVQVIDMCTKSIKDQNVALNMTKGRAIASLSTHLIDNV
ncbi:hypothetical protein BDV95DRAFT_594489 [Massariosphaeria phaeospora]|uniref:Uncharacterized protein n=1 Tax=Massariosphaeria phaeospora TaxID=100035 RepID=A0A7C8I977_9PLEO|nr:hypothetical protein BDV95DRAFT_594489 [Massariosphaeria phaeospora]